MSESDDTDVLLVIPPDFFMVHSSDSEDSFDSYPRESFQHLQQSIVGSLISQINHLENRVCLIENKETLFDSTLQEDFQSLSYPGNTPSLSESTNFEILFDPMSTGNRFGNVSDFPRSLRKYPSKNQTRSRLDKSCEKLPTNVSNSGNNLENSNTTAQVNRISSDKSIFEVGVDHGTNSSDKEAMEKCSEMCAENKSVLNADTVSQERPIQIPPNNLCILSQDNLSFLEEIEEFLKNRNMSDLQGSNTQFTNKDMKNNSKPNLPDVSISHHDDSKQLIVNEPSNSNFVLNKSLCLDEVNHIVAEMEQAQKEIEEKMKQGRAKLDSHNNPELNASMNSPYLCGEIIGSVPDLGLGVRELMMSHNGDSKISRSEIPTRNAFLPQNPNHLDSNVLPLHEQKDIVPNSDVPKTTYVCGDTIGSVPDLGFGVREVMMNNSNKATNSDDNRVPITEEPIVPKHFTNLGSQICNVTSNFERQPLSEQHQGNSSKQIVQRLPESFSNHKSTYVPHLENIDCLKLPNPDTRVNVSDQYSAKYTNFPAKTSQTKIFSPDNEALGNNQGNWKPGSVIANPPGVTARQTAPPVPKIHKFDNQTQAVHFSSSDTSTNSEIRQQGANILGNKNVEFQLEKISRDEDLSSKKRFGSSLENDYLLLMGGTPSTTNLLSLSDLWGSESTLNLQGSKSDPATLTQKLEEERYRRQHCEQLIQRLQWGLLEERQKLAVAVRVDKGKDRAITQLQEGWSRIVKHWHELEEQRHQLASQLQQQKDVLRLNTITMEKKLKSLEEELSKALDLAQGYKRKCDDLELKICDLCEKHSVEVSNLESKLASESKHAENLQGVNEDLQQALNEKEKELIEKRESIEQAKKQIEENKKTLHTYEAELRSFREEKENLQLKLKQERAKNDTLQKHKLSLETETEDIKKKEKAAREESKNLMDQMKKLKNELRDHYQRQVDSMVQEKLKEFQAQLDAAEVSLQNELQTREHAMADALSDKVKQLAEKFHTEIGLVERKHQEEIQLYQLQLQQASQQISQLNTQLSNYKSRKEEVAEKLKNIMEKQWQEAMRIVSTNSPFLIPDNENKFHKRNVNPDIGYEKEYKKQSEDLQGDLAKVSLHTFHTPLTSKQQIPQLNIPNPSSKSSSNDEAPFNKEGQLTYRLPANQEVSRATEDLKKYIEQLLDRSPGNPVTDSLSLQEAERDKQVTKGLFESVRWEPLTDQSSVSTQSSRPSSGIPAFESSRSCNGPPRECMKNKPPWK